MKAWRSGRKTIEGWTVWAEGDIAKGVVDTLGKPGLVRRDRARTEPTKADVGVSSVVAGVRTTPSETGEAGSDSDSAQVQSGSKGKHTFRVGYHHVRSLLPISIRDGTKITARGRVTNE